jgi:hypothetical protein
MTEPKSQKVNTLTIDPRLKQYRFSEAMQALGYKTRASVYKLVENGYLELIHPQNNTSRITGSSLMDYLEATNAGKSPQAKYTKKDARAIEAAAPVKAEKGSSAADKLREWMGIKR